METVTVACPACRQMLHVPDRLVGELVKCPACGGTFAAPDGPERVLPPAPPPVARVVGRPRTRYDEGPEPVVLARAGEKPAKVQAVAIMTLAGGIWAILVAVGLAGTFIGLAWPGTYYSLVLGILATVRGSRLLGERAYGEAPPRGTAIMQIINIVAFDPVNLTLGILNLVFLNEREVRGYFRG
jgi:hypothetical protein